MLEPRFGKLEQCHGASIDAAVFECRLCGTVTTEPLR